IEKIIEKNQKNVALHLTLIVLLFIIPFVVRKYITFVLILIIKALF
ncbi:hypothetical protein J830_4486, partial [Acinetobacter baumannii 25691_7]